MDKLTYNAPELALLLGISRSAAYNLMHRADFPSFRIGAVDKPHQIFRLTDRRLTI